MKRNYSTHNALYIGDTFGSGFIWALWGTNDGNPIAALSEGVAKARKYKNRYTNITVTKVSKGYKVSAVRHPSMDNDSLKMYQIIAPVNGKPMIVEEMMQTRQQIFLKYAK